MCKAGLSLVSWSGWPGLATWGSLRQACHLAPAFPLLCLHAGWTVCGNAVENPPGNGRGFPQHCQCHENLRVSVGCPALGRTAKRGKHNGEVGQREASVTCRFCFLPGGENSFPLFNLLCPDRGQVLLRAAVRGNKNFSSSFCFPCPPSNNLKESLTPAFEKFIETPS